MTLQRKNLGQGMTEYIIIVAIIAISAIGVTKGTSNYLKIGFAKIAYALKGEKKQGGTYEKIDAQDTQGRNMGDFNEGVEK